MFWFLMRVLALFYHRKVVLERKCFTCQAKNISKLYRGNSLNGIDTVLDYYILSYEGSGEEDDDQSKEDNEQSRNEECDVCQTLWWNSEGIPEKYSERDIGITKWGTRLNGVISIAWLMVALSILSFYFVSFVPLLFGNSEEILKLLIKLTLFALLVTHYLAALSSKLRSVFKSGAARLSWATVMNARYLIKRGQFLDMPNRGLPGRLFFILCFLCPSIITSYRVAIWLYLSDCDITFYSMTQALIGAVFTVNWGLSIYILYFVRVSFQCQFNLVLSYIGEYKDFDFGRAKAVILDVAADFACYCNLCSLYLTVNMPTVALAVVSNLTLDYTVSGSECFANEKSRRIVIHVAVLSWSEIAMAMILSAVAMGGYKVRYLWENFASNFMIVTSAGSKKNSVKSLLHEAEYLLRESNVLLATMVFSVTGIYMGFQFGYQNITMLHDSCNGTIVLNGCI